MKLDIQQMIDSKASDLIKKVMEKSPGYEEIPNFDAFLKVVISLSMRKGFLWGVSSVRASANLMIKDLGEELPDLPDEHDGDKDLELDSAIPKEGF